MNRIKKHLAKRTFRNQPVTSRSNVIFLSIIIVIIAIIGVIVLPDFSPFFSHPTTAVIRSLRSTISRAKPVSFFKLTPKQNPNTILDQPLASSGCNAPLTLKPGQATYMEIDSGKSKRRFIVYLPDHYNNQTSHPLILAFHGYAADAFAIEKFAKFDTLANRDNVIMVYPEGSGSLANLRGWNTGLHPTIHTNDVLFVSNILNEVQSNLCVNPQRIYATGFSNGGGFVALLACQLSNRIAAFAPVSGSYVTAFKTCSATRPVPIIEFHGNKDTTVPYPGLAAKKELGAFTWVSQWAQRDQCSKNPTTTNQNNKAIKYEWTNCNDDANVIHYKILGEPHMWPQLLFQATVSHHMQRFNTAGIIWSFFAQHPLPQNS